MTSVNVKDLNRMIEAKRLERNVAFNKLYDICQQRIISHAKKDKMRTIFEMPEFILGIPPFNLNDALTHVIERLKGNGFLVMYFFPKLLYISWDTDEINGRKIIQPVAMLPGHQGHVVPLKLASSSSPIIAPPQALQTSNATLVPVINPQHQYRDISTSNKPAAPPPYIPPHMPALDLPMPMSSTRKQPKAKPDNPDQNRFFKSISDYKPSGKFVLDLN